MMRILVECNKLVLGVVILFLCSVSGVFADSWQERACVRNEASPTCIGVSQNFKEPYCITTAPYGKDFAFNCIDISLTDFLSPKDSAGQNKLGELTMREILKNYCSLLYNDSGRGRIYFAKPSGQTTSWDWQQTFDSHQSLFVYALCSSFKDKDGKMIFLSGYDVPIGGVFVGDGKELDKILRLQQMDKNGKNRCFPEDLHYDLHDCDMSIFATKIYETIMSDLYKIEYAQVLNVDKFEDFDNQDKVLDFMSGYILRDKSDEYIKIRNNYPKSLGVLESNQMFYKNVLETVKIIKNSDLADKANKSGCPVVGDMTGVDFVACALHSSQRNKFALTPSFVTLIYNEILHYRLFITYYGSWMNEKIKLKHNSSDESEEKLLNSKLSDFDWYSQKQLEATNLVQRDFENFNMTYPLHIGLLMYIEKVEKFRNNSLSKIITSFYSLSEKLQNVQQPAS